MPPNRLEAFSDGVFAVAITLLALDLTIDGPGPGHAPLADQLRRQWPSFAAYAVSFFVIGITWVNHHDLLKSFARVDRALLFLNLLLLLFIVAIPFATSTMAAYLREGGTDAHLAAALYAAVLEGMGLSFAAIFAWSIRGTNRRVPLSAAAARVTGARFGLGAIVYLVAIAVAFISAPAALVLIAAIAVYYMFQHTSPHEDAQE
jgi:uncharacterized membrane protein